MRGASYVCTLRRKNGQLTFPAQSKGAESRANIRISRLHPGPFVRCLLCIYREGADKENNAVRNFYFVPGIGVTTE